MPEPQFLTRRQLYDLIWSKPPIKLAEDLGISDVAKGSVRITLEEQYDSTPHVITSKEKAY